MEFALAVESYEGAPVEFLLLQVALTLRQENVTPVCLLFTTDSRRAAVWMLLSGTETMIRRQADEFRALREVREVTLSIWDGTLSLPTAPEPGPSKPNLPASISPVA